jgi:hypothetical protein
VVTFFSREYGKVRGVARAARRPRSRFSGALELFTLGQLVFFDTGRSDLLRVDHFDVLRPLARLRDDLDRLGHASWLVECVNRLTADRDPNVALYGLLTRSLRAMEVARPGRVAVCFVARALDVLGHRPATRRMYGVRPPGAIPAGAARRGGPRLRRVRSGPSCARADLGPGPRLASSGCGPRRGTRSLPRRSGRLEGELKIVLEAHLTRLIGQAPRATKFLREVRRLSEIAGDRE